MRFGKKVVIRHWQLFEQRLTYLDIFYGTSINDIWWTISVWLTWTKDNLDKFGHFSALKWLQSLWQFWGQFGGQFGRQFQGQFFGQFVVTLFGKISVTILGSISRTINGQFDRQIIAQIGG